MTISTNCAACHPCGHTRFFQILDHALVIKSTLASRPRRIRTIAPGQTNGLLKPRIDILDDPELSVITCQVELPGMKRTDVSVHIQDGRLVISGERRPTLGSSESQQQPTSFLVREVKYGKFRREIILPQNLESDEISASIADGMLTITWPRVSAATESPQRIEVLDE